MRTGLIILAGVAIVALGLFGLSDREPELIELRVDNSNTPPPQLTEITGKIIPKVYDVETISTTIKSKNYDSDGSRVADDFDIPALIPDADAQSTDELRVKVWRFNLYPSSYAFDSDGNLFASRDHEIARIDVSDNKQKIWDTPLGWNIRNYYGDNGVVDSSGNYYFRSSVDRPGYYGSALTRLDVDSDVFTQWDVKPTSTMMHYDGSIYFSSNIYFADEVDALDVTLIVKYDGDDELIVEGEKASGRVDVEVTTPSNQTFTDFTYANSDATFHTYVNNVFEDDLFSATDIGNYTVRVTDMHNQTVEKIFYLNDKNIFAGRSPEPSTTRQVFLQQFNPSDSTLTSYLSNNPESISSLSLIDKSGLFYFVSYDNDNAIIRFNPTTNQISSWSGIDQISHDLAVIDSNVYWGGYIGRDTISIHSLNLNDGTIKSSSPSYECTRGVSHITSSMNDVFFHGCDSYTYKFDPSGETFTKFFDYDLGDSYLGSDSNGKIYWADGNEMGVLEPATIRILERVVDSSTQISIHTNDLLTGTPNLNEFSISQRTHHSDVFDNFVDIPIRDVTLSEKSIIITLDSPLNIFGTARTQYNGNSITGAEKLFYDGFDDYLYGGYILDHNFPTLVTPTQMYLDISDGFIDTIGINNFTVNDNVVSNIDYSNDFIEFTVEIPIKPHDVTMLSYEGTGIFYNDGTVVKEFTTPVHNALPITIEKISVTTPNQIQIVTNTNLILDEDMSDTNQITNDFIVSDNSVTAVDIADNLIILTLETQLNSDSEVSLSYNQFYTNIRASNGAALHHFDSVPATNELPPPAEDASN